MATDNCLTRPKVEDIAACITTEMGQLLLGGKAVHPDSALGIIAGIVAGAIFETHGDIAKLYDQLFIDKMCCDAVEKFAKSIDIAKRAPAKAIGYVTVTGVALTTIPATLTFVSGTNGQEYELDPDFPNPSALDSAGSAVLRVRAVLPGIAGNLDATTAQAVTTTISVAGIGQTATVAGTGMGGGAEEETCEQLRARLKVMRRSAAACGNLAFYRNAVMSFSGVEKVCFSGCKCNDCCDSGMITVYPFFDKSIYQPYGIPPKVVTDAIRDYVWGTPMGAGYGLAPAGAYGQVLCAEPALINVKVYTQGVANPQQAAAGKAAVQEYFDGIVCVGETLCNSDLVANLVRALPRLCIRGAVMCSDDLVTTTTGDVMLGCGKFPVLENVTFLNGPVPALPCG